MDYPQGVVVFTPVGSPTYGFDVYSLKLTSDLSKLSNSDEHRLTDGVSINYNAQFVPGNNDSVVHISERNGFLSIFLSTPHLSKPQQLPLAPESFFHDRPIIKNNRLYFISAHENPRQLFKSWSALYSIDLNHRKLTRLSPYGTIDFSPSLSLSGKYVAVASYGSRPWAGEFHELYTDIVVFKSSEPHKRFVVCERGGWPSWSRDSTIYFHRVAEDGWWSIFQLQFPENSDDFSGFSGEPVRVTPPGVHCFTPAAMHDGKRIAVATRRRNQNYRHIEIFDVETSTFYPVTEKLNPDIHHYNPFVSQDSSFIGYHRYRGWSACEDTVIPYLDPIRSPIKELHLLRFNGSFPSFSPTGDLIAFNPDFVYSKMNGGLKIVTSNGSKVRTLLKNRVVFSNSWSPTEKNVIYTSLGRGFAPNHAKVQIARVTFDPSDFIADCDEIQCDVKILTREETGNNAFASCSPDGKSLVFRSARSGHKNLYIMDAVNGEFKGGLRLLTEGPWIDTMPSWSPKGDLIAFSSNRHNPDNERTFSIYLIKPDGSGLKRVHMAGSRDASHEDLERINHVCFSRDGEWLLFTANFASVTAEPVSWPNQFQPYGELYAARLDGSGLRRLTWNWCENGTPTWHPAGGDLDLSKLCLDGAVGDKLTGEFDELLWMNCDI